MENSLFISQNCFADSGQEKLFHTEIKKGLGEVSKKRGGSSFSQTIWKGMSTDHVLTSFKTKPLQTSLDHIWREIREMSWKVVEPILNTE